MDRASFEADLARLSELLKKLWYLAEHRNDLGYFGRIEEEQLRKMNILLASIRKFLESAPFESDCRTLLECKTVGSLPGLPINRPRGVIDARRGLDDKWLLKKRQQAAFSALRGIASRARKLARGCLHQKTPVHRVPESKLEAWWQEWVDFTSRLDNELRR